MRQTRTPTPWRRLPAPTPQPLTHPPPHPTNTHTNTPQKVEREEDGAAVLRLTRASSEQVAAWEAEQRRKRIEAINEAAGWPGCRMLAAPGHPAGIAMCGTLLQERVASKAGGGEEEDASGSKPRSALPAHCRSCSGFLTPRLLN